MLPVHTTSSSAILETKPSVSKCAIISRIISIAGGVLIGLIAYSYFPPESCRDLGAQLCKRIGTEQLGYNVRDASYTESSRIPQCHLSADQNTFARFPFTDARLRQYSVNEFSRHCFPKLTEKKILDIFAESQETAPAPLSQRMKNFYRRIFH